MEKFFQSFMTSSVFTLTFYIFMHNKGIPFWVYPAMFILFIALYYGWSYILPPNNEVNRNRLVRIASVLAVILLVVAAIIVTV